MTAEELATVIRTRRMVASGEAKRIRIAAGIRTGELARAIPTTRTTINRWERGENLPEAGTALVLARALDAMRKATP